jgi:hypothetical protein
VDITIDPSAYHHSILALLKAYIAAKTIERRGQATTLLIDGVRLTVSRQGVTIHRR